MNVCSQLVRVDGTDTLITELTPVSAKKTTNPAPRRITFRPAAEFGFFFELRFVISVATFYTITQKVGA